MQLARRTLLVAGAASLGAAAGCGRPADAGRPPRGVRRVRYGPHPSQYADLRLPHRTPLATVVLLHGGYWLQQYAADQLVPLAQRLTALGYATWNVEYRRLGGGGGFPATFEDVATALDRLAEERLDARVLVVGHSAGGHLAVWSASRTARTPGGAPRVRPRLVVPLSGVLDLVRASVVPGSAQPTVALMGGTPQEQPGHYRQGDPTLLVPAACPVVVVHAADDQVVPWEQATRYVAADRAAGGTARLVTVPGDHFTLIEPTAPSFPTLRQVLEQG